MTPLSKAAILLLSIAAFAMLGIAACSQNVPSPSEPTSAPTTTATPVPTPTPINVEDILRRSGEVTSQLESFHFRLEHNDDGSTPFTDTLDIVEAEGDVVSPDSISIDFSGRFSDRFALKARLVTIGSDSYMTNPLTGNWEEVPAEVSPLGFFDPQQGIGAMMTGMRNPVLTSDDDSIFKMEGDLDVEALRPLLGSAAQGDSVRVELTLDRDTLYLKTAVIKGRATSDDPDEIVRTIFLSRYNEPITITVPDTS